MECLYLALSIQFVQLLKLTTLYYLYKYSRLQLCQAIEVPRNREVALPIGRMAMAQLANIGSSINLQQLDLPSANSNEL